MDTPAALPLVVPLPLPAPGGSSRVLLGSSELVLEHTRGAFSLLWSDGREARRYVLGLAARGRLALELRAPRLPLRIVTRETLTLVPGARVRGYVTVPLVPTLVWSDGPTRAETLVELLPRSLQGAWYDDAGHVFGVSTPWLSRFPVPTGEPRAVLPVRLSNRGPRVLCPAHLDLELRDDELKPARGTVVTAPRRIRLDDERQGQRDPSAMGGT